MDPERERVPLPLLPPLVLPRRGNSGMHATSGLPPPLSLSQEDELPLTVLALGIVAERCSDATGGLTGVVGSSAADDAACMHL